MALRERDPGRLRRRSTSGSISDDPYDGFNANDVACLPFLSSCPCWAASGGRGVARIRIAWFQYCGHAPTVPARRRLPVDLDLRSSRSWPDPCIGWAYVDHSGFSSPSSTLPTLGLAALHAHRKRPAITTAESRRAARGRLKTHLVTVYVTSLIRASSAAGITPIRASIHALILRCGRSQA